MLRDPAKWLAGTYAQPTSRTVTHSTAMPDWSRNVQSHDIAGVRLAMVTSRPLAEYRN